MMSSVTAYISVKLVLVLGGLLLYSTEPGNGGNNPHLKNNRLTISTHPHTNRLTAENRREGKSRPCPCTKDKLCEVVKRKVKNEVFAFSVSTQHWQQYGWDKLTTVVEFGSHDDQLMCHAHNLGVRVLQNANFPVTQLTNKTARNEWVQSQVDAMVWNFVDGVNVDFESEIDSDRHDLQTGLTELIQELKTAVTTTFKDGIVTADLGWSPNCIDKRCYDYKAICDIVDVAFIMAYDERSQIHGPCVAYANSAYNVTKSGLQQYLDLGVDPRKLVLGLPWYGYRYLCQVYDQSKTPHLCTIASVPFRGVNCSDAAGSQVSYDGMIKEISHSMTGRVFDQGSMSPYMDVKDPDTGDIYQYWYDDVESLTLKYQLASDLGLKGVGMWNADSLDYSDAEQVNSMWGALP